MRGAFIREDKTEDPTSTFLEKDEVTRE